MNLRAKVLTTLCIAFFVIILVLVAVSFTFLISSYENLESTYVNQDLRQASGKFQDVLSTMSNIAHDWGPWDDTVAFVQGNAPDYLHSNLQPYGFDNLNLNLIVITNTQGDVLFSGAYDLQNKTMVPVPAFFSQKLDLNNPLMNMSDPHAATTGILMLPDDPMFVVSQPIMYSNFSGTPQGVIIMGRYLNREQVSRLASLTQSTLAFRQINDPSLPAGLVARLRQDSPATPGLVQVTNSDQVEGYTLIRDIYGNDALILQIAGPRDIYHQGITTIISFLLLLAIIALVIGIIFIFLIDHLVLSRISDLQYNVDSLGDSGDLSLRLVPEGDDEISHLAQTINTTLDSLETARTNLQKSEAGYRTLVETSPMSIAKIDSSGTILYCNHQMAAAHGYRDEEELKGKFVFHLIAPSDRDRAMKLFATTIRDKGTRIGECRAVKKDGSEFWVEISISPIENLAGDIESFIAVIRDISLRKTWESQLKESEERYRAVFENTGTAMVIIEEDRVISLANSEFERLSGYSRDEIEGKRRWTEFVAKEDLDHMLVQHTARRANSGSAAKKYEFRFIVKSGDVRDILLSVDMIPGTMRSIASLIDITDRKRAENAILESETKLNIIIDSSPFPQFVIDKNHIVIHWNKAMENLSGIAAQDVLGTDRHWTAFYPTPRPCIADLVVDNLIEKIPDYYAGKYAKSMVLPEEYEATDFFPGLGRTGKWLFFSSRRIRDHQGNITGAIETLADITVRKRSEEEMLRANEQLTAAVEELQSTEETLRDNITELQEAKRNLQKSEARYRDITAHIPGIVFQFFVRGTEDFSIPFISDKVIRMFTLGPDEIYSNPDALFNLIHTDDVEYVRSTLLESARTMVPWNVEFRMKSKEATPPRWFNGRALPHKLDTENILWDGVLIDITERKLAEAALVESEHKFRAIFDQSFEFIGLMTPDGTLIEANRAALTFSGIAESDVIGKPFWQTPWWKHSEEMQEKVRDGVRRAVAGEFVRFEATHCQDDGSIHHVDFSIKPVMDEAGSVILLIPEGHDITEQKVLQEEIRAALKEKEMLLKEIHHRVKNNIQVIASLLNMQSRTVEDLNTKEVLREAQNRVKSIALVHEKLYQSKSLDRIDYHDYLQKISRHLAESYGVSQRNITLNIHAENISLHIDKAVPCSLIINELLTNAFKHAFPPGRRGDIWIDLHKHGDSMVLTYRDNGVGLPKDLLIEQSESLGMRLLYGLTRQLHGTIDVEMHEGTHFTITFPVENGQDKAS